MPATAQASQPQRRHIAWTEEMVERLTKLWTEGGRTIGEIAADLSRDTGRTLTRNAVTGKIDRLGLIGKGAMPGKGGRRHRGLAVPEALSTGKAGAAPERAVPSTAKADPTTCERFPVPTPPVAHGGLHPVGRWPMADMRPIGQCKFPCIEEGGRHLFCGEPAPIGPGNPHGSWCEAHRAVVFTESASLGRPAFLRKTQRLL